MTLTNLPPLRSHLYAPGNNARLLEKVFSAGADAVILDLEDAVPPAQKVAAREMVRQIVRTRVGKPEPFTFVRINHPTSGQAEEDVKAVVQPGLAGLRLPKMEDAETVRRIAAWVEQAETSNGVNRNSIAFICGIESATGIWNSLEIATACPRVIALAFGAADYVRDVGITPGPDGLETLYPCSRLVLASRIAGLQPPIDTVFRFLDDPAGLEKAARQAKALGFFGKSVIHPKQVSVVNAVYTPTAKEISDAAQIVALADQAEALGKGAVQDAGGEFIDVAVVRRARGILALADQLTERPGV